MAIIQSDIKSAIQAAAIFRHHHHHHLLHSHFHHRLYFPRAATFHHSPPLRNFKLRIRAFSSKFSETDTATAPSPGSAQKVDTKPPICTADELHYVSVNNSDWRVALWRYHPLPETPKRNHPLLLLSGVGTNAIGYDLSPASSFARYMSGQGFETWILEVRGAGLSTHVSDSKDLEQSAHAISERMKDSVENVGDVAVPSTPSTNVNGESVKTQTTPFDEHQEEYEPTIVDEVTSGISTAWDESQMVNKLTLTLMRLSQRVSGFLSEGQSKIMSAKLFDQISKFVEDSVLFERFNETRARLLSLLESRQNSAVAGQVRDLTQKLVDIIEEGQRSVSPQLFDLQERLTRTIEDFQKQLDLIVMYDWDFDHYLEEDVPAAMEYIKSLTKPKDGKLLAIGHSMGGILLYAMLSRYGYEEQDPPLAAVVTLASSLDYTSSNSALKLLVPLADPAQALNVPVVPLGAMLAAAYPISSRAPYALSWLNDMITSEDMMDPELLKKLVLNNFCTIPTKLLLQLTTAFREGGLRDRSGNFFYKDHLHKSKTPVLALAGDRDLICPPEAVYETVKLFPEQLVTYKLFGQSDGPHYAHYDLVGGSMAVEQLYPCVVEFLSHCDKT